MALAQQVEPPSGNIASSRFGLRQQNLVQVRDGGVDRGVLVPLHAFFLFDVEGRLIAATALLAVSKVERLIGRPERVSAVTGQSDKAAYLWRHGSSSRDAGDIPSTRLMSVLLKHAAANGIPLTAEHLIWVASEADILALLPHAKVAAE